MADSHLKAFLSDFRRSRSREYILTTQLVGDLAVAAAARGYDLLVYLPTVDADGFDVIIDDRDRLVPVQLKSMVKKGKASEWSVHRKLLRPGPGAAELYGFEPSPTGVGRQGGVILTKVAAAGDSKLQVSYAYTDIDVLSALWLGIVPRASPQRKRLKRVRKELETEPSGTIELPTSAFIAVPSPEHLLALMGLRSRLDHPWRLQLQALLRQKHLPHDAPVVGEFSVPEETRRANIKRDLEGLSQVSGHALL